MSRTDACTATSPPAAGTFRRSAPRERSRRALRPAALLALLLAAVGCAPAAPAPFAAAAAPPPLPGVAPEEREWFWRDVLARPLPGEATAAPGLAGIQPDLARLDALTDLASSNHPGAAFALMAALRDPREGVAIAAAHALGQRGDRLAIPRLIKGLGPWPVDFDVPLTVRCAQATALARMGQPAGVPLLLAVLAEGTGAELPEVQLTWRRTPQIVFAQELALPGIEALAGQDFGYRTGGPAPARELAVRAMTEWFQERRVVLWRAVKLDDPGLVARARLLLGHLDAYQLRQIDGARFTLAQLGPALLPLATPNLRAPNVYLRLHTLEVLAALADVCDPKDRVRLANAAAVALLDDPAPEVAAQAARLMAATGVADQLLVALERRREAEVLTAVVDALAACAAEAALPALRRHGEALASSASPDVRAAFHAARLRLDPSADAEPYLELLGSSDPQAAFAAFDRLADLLAGDAHLDPGAPAAERAAAVAAVRAALAERAAALR